MIIKLAFRNIFRNKKRTILTLVTIVFGIFVSIFGNGLNSGLKWQLADVYVKTETGSFKIYKKGFYSKDDNNDPLKFSIENETEITDFLENDPEVISFSKRISFSGQITNGNIELPAKFLGIDPDYEHSVFKIKDCIRAGEFLLATDFEKIVIGNEMASSMKLKTGDYVTLIARDKNRTINAYDVMIKGIVETDNPLLNSRLILLSNQFAKAFANTEYVNDIAVLCINSELEQLKRFLSKNEKKFKEYNVEGIGWFELVSDLFQLIEFREKIFLLITAVILIMAGAGIANTMLMSMLERKKEIGIMMACGMEKKSILFLFLFEGMIIGIIGSVIGVVIGSVLVNYYQIHGLPIPAGKGNPTDMGIPIEHKIYLYLDHVSVCYFFILGIITSAVSALYPAYKATHLNPVEAIRE